MHAPSRMTWEEIQAILNPQPGDVFIDTTNDRRVIYTEGVGWEPIRGADFGGSDPA